MRAAIDAIKSVRAARDLGIFADNYIAKDGTIYASDGRMAAAIACSTLDGINRLIPGDELEKLISRLPDDVTLRLNDQSITIASGRMRGTITTRDPADMMMLMPDEEWRVPPPGLINAMKLARPFVADVAAQPFATCLFLRDGAVLATTNIALIQVECPGLAPDADRLLPAWAADFVLKASGAAGDLIGPLSGLILNDRYAAFRWAGGLWLRTQLVTGAFPAAVGSLLAEVAPTQPLAITAPWRRAYAAVAAISEGVITIEPDRIVGGHRHSRVEHDVEPIDIGEAVRFDPKYLSPVVELAQARNPAAFPRPVSFVAPGVRGLIAGRRA